MSTDWLEPLNYIIPQFDSTDVSGGLSTVQYDNMIRADLPGRIYITLRNDKFQQKNEWLPNLTGLQINFFRNINGATWATADDLCQVQKSRGIYPGEYMAWFNCTTA